MYCSPEGKRLEEVSMAELAITQGGIVIQARSMTGFMPSLFLQALKFLLQATV